MAVAVKNVSEAKTAASAPNLAWRGLLGALYITAMVGAVFYYLPMLWADSVTPLLAGRPFLDGSLRVVSQLLTLVVLSFVGIRMGRSQPPVGTRGSIFLTFCVLFTAFFLTRAVASWVQRFAYENSVPSDSQGYLILAGIGVGFLVLGWTFLRSPRARRWMVSLEEQGWFSTDPYKKAQGLKVRRLTMLGVLIVLGCGVYSLMNSSLLTTGPTNWEVTIPLVLDNAGNTLRIPLIPDRQFSIPLLLIAATLWFSYRLINVPAFADFLVATEAEMNKVSWSTKKQLISDTIVVLATVILMALFLLLVDMFWGFLLKRIDVLPEGASQSQQEAVKTLEW